MAISYVGSVAGINNAPLALPAHLPNDIIILFTAGDASNQGIAPTPGFNNTEANSSPFPRPLGVIPAMLTETVISDGSMTVVPPNSATGDFSRIAMIYRGANINSPATTLQFLGDHISPSEGDTRINFPDAASANPQSRWYINFSSVVMDGDPEDLTTPPISLTRRITIADQQRIAAYDSNGNVGSFPATNGPIFSTGDHEWRSHAFFLFQMDGAYLSQTLANITLNSTAEVVDPPPPIDAELISTLDDVILDSTASIPEVRKASLVAELENVTLDSEAEITLPEITASVDGAVLDDVELISRARNGMNARLVATLDDVKLKATAQADGRVANLVAILDDVRLESKAQITGASLVAILDDVRLESTAMIKGINANLTQPLEDVIVHSQATITQPQNWYKRTDCCPPRLCDLDPCSMICNFVSLLPSGPLWDEPKRRVLEKYSASQFCGDEPRDLGDCGTIVDHAVYTALKLYDVLQNALFPAIREADPMTAYDTMDDWLERLRWQSCAENVCQLPAINGLLPNQMQGPCGICILEIEYEECLVTALKHATIVALTRMQFGGIKNLCFINSVIEPLGAIIYPTPGSDESCPAMTIAPTRTTFPIWNKLTCLPQGEGECQAYAEPNKGGRTPFPDKIYPGLIAAECIVRSMLPQSACLELHRLCEVPDPLPITCFPEM